MSPPLLPTAAVRPAHNWRQLAVVCALIVPEAMQGNVLSPFLPFLVRRYWHLPERDTALYVGLLSGAFFLAQALTTPAWGYCSDRIGRRPVILISLLGSALGAYAFATARTFRVACLARLFVGFFDAHLAITKTYITEASDVSTVASGFALLSVMWGVGQTIAPLVGGFLADPASRFSGVSWAVFPLVAEYPYALPSLFSCACSLAALFAAWTWLQDTAVFSKARSATAEDPPDGVNGRGAGTDVAVNTAAIEPAAAPAAVSAALPHMTFRELCVTPAITGTVLCYVLMSAYQVMFDAMTPVLLQLRPEAGGLGYSSAAIGLSQLWAGITPIVAQLIFVPHAIRTYGPLRCYRTTMLASLAFAALPVVCLAAASGAPPWSVFALLSVAQVARAAVTALAFTSCNVLLGMSGQGRGLGAINGVAMSAGALTRALAPALGGAIFAASLDWRALGSARLYVVFVFGAAAAGCGALVASRLPPWMQEPPPSPAAGPVDLSPGKDVPMVWPAGSGRGGGGLGVSSPRGSPGPSLLAQADVEAVVPTTSSGSITAHSRAIGRMAR